MYVMPNKMTPPNPFPTREEKAQTLLCAPFYPELLQGRSPGNVGSVCVCIGPYGKPDADGEACWTLRFTVDHSVVVPSR